MPCAHAFLQAAKKNPGNDQSRNFFHLLGLGCRFDFCPFFSSFSCKVVLPGCHSLIGAATSPACNRQWNSCLRDQTMPKRNSLWSWLARLLGTKSEKIAKQTRQLYLEWLEDRITPRGGRGHHHSPPPPHHAPAHAAPAHPPAQQVAVVHTPAAVVHQATAPAAHVVSVPPAVHQVIAPAVHQATAPAAHQAAAPAAGHTQVNQIAALSAVHAQAHQAAGASAAHTQANPTAALSAGTQTGSKQQVLSGAGTNLTILGSAKNSLRIVAPLQQGNQQSISPVVRFFNSLGTGECVGADKDCTVAIPGGKSPAQLNAFQRGGYEHDFAMKNSGQPWYNLLDPRVRSAHVNLIVTWAEPTSLPSSIPGGIAFVVDGGGKLANVPLNWVAQQQVPILSPAASRLSSGVTFVSNSLEGGLNYVADTLDTGVTQVVNAGTWFVGKTADVAKSAVNATGDFIQGRTSEPSGPPLAQGSASGSSSSAPTVAKPDPGTSLKSPGVTGPASGQNSGSSSSAQPH